MTYEQESLEEFEVWVDSQIATSEMAMEASHKVMEEDKDERTADAYVRYESKLDAYKLTQGKFANYRTGKGFHELPDNLLGGRSY